jgi:hypothetical protein
MKNLIFLAVLFTDLSVRANEVTNSYLPQTIQQGRFACGGLTIIVKNGRDNIYHTPKEVLSSVVSEGQVDVSIWNPHLNEYVSFGCTQEVFE